MYIVISLGLLHVAIFILSPINYFILNMLQFINPFYQYKFMFIQIFCYYKPFYIMSSLIPEQLFPLSIYWGMKFLGFRTCYHINAWFYIIMPNIFLKRLNWFTFLPTMYKNPLSLQHLAEKLSIWGVIWGLGIEKFCPWEIFKCNEKKLMWFH